MAVFEGECGDLETMWTWMSCKVALDEANVIFCPKTPILISLLVVK